MGFLNSSGGIKVSEFASICLLKEAPFSNDQSENQIFQTLEFKDVSASKSIKNYFSTAFFPGKNSYPNKGSSLEKKH